jgi:pyruvate formate lyase activating enzyme
MAQTRPASEVPPMLPTFGVLFDPGRCIDCGRCVAICPHSSTPRVRWLNASQVLEIIFQTIDGPSAIGQLFVSGGEPAAWPDFLDELKSQARIAGLADPIIICEF